MGKVLKKKKEVKSSALRIFGAAFFGFLLGSFVRAIVNYTVPNILVKIKRLTLDEAIFAYTSSTFTNLFLSALIVFLTAGIAAFLARKKGILTGILTNIIPILFWAGAILFVFAAGVRPLAVFTSVPFFQFLFIILSSVLGGFLGEKFYLEERDLDLGKEGMTIFGIYWLHYLWILPLIFYPFISAVVAVVFSWTFTFSTELYFVSHPKLWINLAWWFYFFVNPLLVLLSAMTILFSFMRFWDVMQYKQSLYSGWGKVKQVFLFGVLGPVISKIISNFSANSTYNMDKPIVNDWKVSLAYVLIIPLAGLIIWFIWGVKLKITNGRKKKKA